MSNESRKKTRPYRFSENAIKDDLLPFTKVGNGDVFSVEEIRYMMKRLSQNIVIESSLENDSSYYFAYDDTKEDNTYLVKFIDPVRIARELMKKDSPSAEDLSFNAILKSPAFSIAEELAYDEFVSCMKLAEKPLRNCIRIFKEYMWRCCLDKRFGYFVTMEQLVAPLTNVSSNFNYVELAYEMSRQLLPVIDDLSQFYQIYNRKYDFDHIMIRSRTDSANDIIATEFCFMDFSSSPNKTSTDQLVSEHPKISADLCSFSNMIQQHIPEDIYIDSKFDEILKKAANTEDGYESGSQMLSELTRYYQNNYLARKQREQADSIDFDAGLKTFSFKKEISGPIELNAIKLMIKKISRGSIEILEDMDAGRSCQLYLAQDSKTKIQYVIKFIDPIDLAKKSESFRKSQLKTIVSAPEFKQYERFAQTEFRACIRLANKPLHNCVRFYKKWMWICELEHRTCYIVTMEKLDSHLETYTKRFNDTEVIHEMSRQLLPTIDILAKYYHIYHRDLSNSNIMVRSAKNPNDLVNADFCIIDFGSASLEVYESNDIGTPPFKAPEKDRNSEIYESVSEKFFKEHPGEPLQFDITADLFSIGMIFKDRYHSHLNDQLLEILDKATAENPSNRYQSGREMLNAIETNYQEVYLPLKTDDTVHFLKIKNEKFAEKISIQSQKIQELNEKVKKQKASLSRRNIIRATQMPELKGARFSRIHMSLSSLPIILLIIALTIVGTLSTQKYLSPMLAVKPDTGYYKGIFVQDLNGSQYDAFEFINPNGEPEYYGNLNLLFPKGILKNVGRYLTNSECKTILLYDSGDVFVLKENDSNIIDSLYTGISQILPMPENAALLKSDGSIELVEPTSEFENSNEWTDISSLCYTNGILIGLGNNGNIQTCGINSVGYNFDGWHSIKKIVSFDDAVIGITYDGDVFATGKNNYETITNWKNVSNIVRYSGTEIGLVNGQLLIANESALTANDINRLSSLKRVADISASDHHLAILNKDGIVKCIGTNKYGECSTFNWDNIARVEAYDQMTIGYSHDGNVAEIAGLYPHSQIIPANVSSQITSISISPTNTAVLFSDHSVKIFGENNYHQIEKMNIMSTDMKQIIAGNGFVIGVNNDNELLFSGDALDLTIGNLSRIPVKSVNYENDEILITRMDDSQMTIPLQEQFRSNVSFLPPNNNLGIENKIDHQDTNSFATINYMKDGSILINGEFHDIDLRDQREVDKYYSNPAKNVYVFSHSNIRQIAATNDAIFTLLSNGTVRVSDTHRNIYKEVESWSPDVIAIACGNTHIIGLHSDGTVSAAGANRHNQSRVTGWENIEKIYACENYSLGITKEGKILSAGRIFLNSEDNEWNQIEELSVSDLYIVGFSDIDEPKIYSIDPSREISVDNSVKQVTTAFDGKAYILKTNGDVIEATNRRNKIMTGIKELANMENSLIGLKNDGTLYVHGSEIGDELSPMIWNNIISISAGPDTLIAETGDERILVYGSYNPGLTDNALKIFDDIIHFFTNIYETIMDRIETTNQ